MKRLSLVIVALAAACPAVLPAEAVAWSWQLPAARYQGLNQFERRQYDKAAALVEKQDYKTAAGEFEKFQAEFPDSSMLSYMLFMRGYCLEQSNNRNTAVKVYQEVIDYFPEKVEDCAAALYHIGLSQLDNGDMLKGVRAFRALADDPRYKDQPLTAGAIRRLGDHYWSRRQYEAAVKCWKQVVANYTGQNDEEANVAANNVISWYVKNRDYAGYEAWLVNDRNRADAPVRKRLVERAYGVAWNGFSTDWEKYAAASEKDRIEKNKLKTEDMKAFYQYLKSRREWFDKAGDTWGYHELALQFLTSLWGDRVSREAAANDALALIKQIKDKSDADNKLARLVDFLNQQGQYERARYLLPMIQDKILALFKDYELLAHENKWAEATARLEEVEKGGNPQWKQRAVWNRAEVYKEHTGQYEKAIKLFEQINQPPGTLWEIQECYHRENKLKEALATLTEIEAMFPDDASRAAWQRAAYLIEAHDRKNAVAQSRRIMKMYPKSQESAAAHRWLEDNGVLSGGGVSDQ
ncbi:MAG: tetratricopeptide repeat protein [Thermoguttaceae bacterium]